MNPSSKLLSLGMGFAAVSMALVAGCSQVPLNTPPVIDRSVPAAGPAPIASTMTPQGASATVPPPAPMPAQPETESEALIAPGAIQAQPLPGAGTSGSAMTPGMTPATPVTPTAPLPGVAMAAPSTPGAEAPLPSSPAPGGALPAVGSWIWPVHGDIVAKFDGKASRGIDIAVAGGENVVAAAPGTVLYAGSMRGYDRLVILRHADGLVSVYAHNRSNLVREGQTVQQGDPIAIVGGEGAPSIFHFEVRRAGVPLDPTPFLGAMNSAP